MSNKVFPEPLLTEFEEILDNSGPDGEVVDDTDEDPNYDCIGEETEKCEVLVMASRRHSPLVGQTWHHASIPVPVDTAPPNSKGFSPPVTSTSMMPPTECSWSSDWKNLFADTNSSDSPGQSAASSASWSDDLENESSQKLSEQYDQIESILYGDSSSGDQLPNPNLALECKQWKERFPHIRAVGVSIKGSSSGDCSSTEIESHEEEEVIAADGNCEDILQQQLTVNNEVQVNYQAFEITQEEIDKYKDKVKKTVLDQIFSKIWPNIIKKIDPVFKKILERNKLALQTTPKICIENNIPLQNSELMYSNNDKYLRVSPEPLRETSPKKSPSATSPIPPVNPKVRDCTAPQINPLKIRNSPSILKVISKNASTTKLGQPPPKVFPSAEKLLSPIPPETRNILQSARIRKKLAPKNSCPSGKTKQNIQQPPDPEQEEGRFYSKDEGRSGVKFNVKKSARGYWNRHGMLPPISSKENIKTSSAATQRSASALQKLGKADLEARPNTSLPNKNGMTLLPLNEGNKKKSRIELAQEWLEKQLSSANNGKHNLSSHVDTASRWRAHHLSHRK